MAERSEARATIGARFKGWNRYGVLRWSVTCEVKTVEEARELAYSTLTRDREMARWRYRLEPASGGTDVTESFEVVWLPLTARIAEDLLMVDRDRRREQAMRTTLERIKAVVEATGASATRPGRLVSWTAPSRSGDLVSCWGAGSGFHPSSSRPSC